MRQLEAQLEGLKKGATHNPAGARTHTGRCWVQNHALQKTSEFGGRLSGVGVVISLRLSG
jgi:hypothetical protein